MANPATATQGDSVRLSASLAAVCGVGATCGPVTVTFHYLDRDGTDVAVPATRDSIGADVATVPGEEVRWPTLATAVEARRTETSASGVVEMYDRYPATGYATTVVRNRIRMQFILPDGQAATGVKVTFVPLPGGETWSQTTNASGEVSLLIPDGDWVLDRAENHRYGQVEVFAFDNWPTTDEGLPSTRSGNGADVIAEVNLGHPGLEARDDLQDATIALRPMTQAFEPAAIPPISFPESCAANFDPVAQNWGCEELIAEKSSDNPGDNTEPLPGPFNVGGGHLVGAAWTFTDSALVETQYAQSFDGLVFSTSAEKVTFASHSNHTNGVGSEATPIGPHVNLQPTISTWWGKYRTMICDQWGCTRGPTKWRPSKWTGGIGQRSHAGRHDQYTGAGCAAPTGTNRGYRVSTDVKGKDIRYDLTIGTEVQIYGVRAGIRFWSKAESQRQIGTQTLEWWLRLNEPGNHGGDNNFQLWVYPGVSDPDGNEGQACPADAPNRAWTDSIYTNVPV